MILAKLLSQKKGGPLEPFLSSHISAYDDFNTIVPTDFILLVQILFHFQMGTNPSPRTLGRGHAGHHLRTRLSPKPAPAIQTLEIQKNQSFPAQLYQK